MVRREGGASRTATLKVAERQLGERGAAGLRLTGIARDLGVSHAALHRSLDGNPALGSR